MIKSIDPGLDMEALHAPTAEEIRELTERTSAAARARVEDAARALLVAKMQADDTTPWRELVEAYRASEPVQIEVEVVDDAGTPRVQVAFIERGFGIEGTAGRVHACVGELVRSLDLIAQERERNRSYGARGGPKPKTSGEVIAGYLKRRNYESAPNKKALVIEAADHFRVGKSTITKAITDHGLSSRSKVKRK